MPPRKTTEQFIQDAIRVHGERYIYSKVNYVNADTKVEIICPEHGSWQCTPNSHTSKKSGCPECAILLRSNQRRKSLDEFIADARAVHGTKYEYSKVVYVGVFIKVIIICPDHDDFEQTPNSHLRGSGCPKCACTKKTTASFIAEAQLIHSDRYIYSEVDYKNNHEKVIIICQIHGEFRQKPFDHLGGHGCKQCANENLRCDTAFFIARSMKIHGDKFDYSLSKYVSNYTPVTIICTHCDFTFERAPRDHYRTKGCPRCIYKTQDEFLTEAFDVHGDLYDYSKVKYTRVKDEVEIICPLHESFFQIANNHLKGQGCPRCVNKTENLLLEHLQVYFPKVKYQYKVEWCKRVSYLRFDLVLVNQNIIIELDGAQHFEQVSNWDSPEDQQQTDAFKTRAANKNGFSVIRLLQEDVWKNTYDWLTELLELIKKIREDDEVQNVFMCKKNEYEPLRKLLSQQL